MKLSGIFWQILLATVLSIGGWLGSIASARADAFDDAARLYERGQALEAASMYEQIATTRGYSYALLYNMGNAYFRAGSPGMAIWAWREAEYLNPRHSDLQANLALAANRGNLPVAKGLADGTLRRIRLCESAWAAFTATLVWATLLSFGRTLPALYHKTTSLRWLAGIATLCFWALYGTKYWANLTGPNCIVVAHDTAVRFGPLEEAPVAFPAPEGSELRIVGSRNGWFQVTDSNAKPGWIDQKHVKRRLP
ncbi:MAG TPA: hypothetical protein VMF06_06590 [Candidatus Limnocylindria bacterium]|jgi:hypothetical protein|nr:hypothetical protein [Candidatus Limnocylindria bacterium]